MRILWKYKKAWGYVGGETMILIKNGRVMDPKTGFDEITDVVLKEDKSTSVKLNV